jgi:hypothetical protein
MAKNKVDKTGKRRTQVKDLPKQEKELNKDEQKKVKGGDTGDILTRKGSSKKESSLSSL